MKNLIAISEKMRSSKNTVVSIMQKPVLVEVLTAEKIIQNCLDCYDLNKVQANNMTRDLALNILKDLQSKRLCQIAFLLTFCRFV